MPVPKLVQVSVDTGGRTYIAVDRDGGVWRGETKRDQSGGEYIAWKRIHSEFERDR